MDSAPGRDTTAAVMSRAGINMKYLPAGTSEQVAVFRNTLALCAYRYDDMFKAGGERTVS